MRQYQSSPYGVGTGFWPREPVDHGAKDICAEMRKVFPNANNQEQDCQVTQGEEVISADTALPCL